MTESLPKLPPDRGNARPPAPARSEDRTSCAPETPKVPPSDDRASSPPSARVDGDDPDLLEREANENAQRVAAHLPPRPHATKIRQFGREWEWRGFKDLLLHNLLHLDDTPHRIALGVFLGFFIGATPTIGIQVAMYWVVASVVGANRVSGIGPIWLSNPVTAVPLYYGEWQIGRLLVTGSWGSPEVLAPIVQRMAPHEGQSWLARMFDTELWVALFRGMVDLGAELWIGSLVCGLAAGLVAYWAAYRAVVAYRVRMRP